MPKIRIGLDCETHDPLLKTAGYSWKYNKGYILNTALYYAAEDRVEVIAGIHNENCPYDKQTRENGNNKIKAILQDPNVCIIGGNLQYDLGWLLYEYGMSTYDVKCSFVDVLQAEAILDEFGVHSVESVSRKYLNYGKSKDRIEYWIRENISAKGDFRQYLKDAPWDMLVEYVSGDAKNPVKVWEKQLPLLKEQDLCKRAKLEFDCILPTLQMTMYGMPIDAKQKKKNLKMLSDAIDKLSKEFIEKYNMPNFRVTASNDIATFLDSCNISYNYKITLTGYNGERFKNGDEIDTAYMRAKRIVSEFHLVKGSPVAFVPKELADRTCDLLSEEGFLFNSSPNIDKGFLAANKDNYPEVNLIANWKLAEGIKSKILGEKYDRFLTKNFKGEDCVKPQFRITDTVSFRYSSNMANLQQVPSKGGFSAYGVEYSFPQLTRALFTASKSCVFGKIDYGQIEYRLICNIACGQAGEDVREQYRQNPHMDFHQYVVDLTGLSRKYAKNMSFGCFSSDSLFLTDKGWKYVDSFTSDNVLDLQGNKQNNKHFIFKDKGLKFTLSNGVQFIVNKEHLFLDCEKAEYEMLTKKAIDMQLGDRVPLSLLKANGEETMPPSLAYLAGLYIGDGCGCNCSLGLISHKENFSFVSECLKANGFSYSYREEAKVIRFTVHKEAKSFFKQFGDRTATKHLIPAIFSATEDIRLAFLAGLLDSDGSVNTTDIRFMGTNEHLMREVALLCATLGFDCGFNVCNREKDNKPTEYTVLVYNLNGKEIPSRYRKAIFKQAKTDVKGWKLDRNGKILVDTKNSERLHINNTKLYDYIRRKARNLFAHNSYIPSACWQKNYIPCVITGIEEVQEATFVFLQTESEYYNAMGVATHNCAFGMSLPSMAETFGWTMEKAQEISEAYHKHMPFVAPTLALVGDVAKKRGYIKTAYGSHARLLDPKKSYTMLNRYTQGSGAECLKLAIVQAYKEGIWKKIKVANTVHDELNMPYLEPTEDSMRALYRMAEIMRTAMPGLRVPLEASPEIGDNWASTKTIPEWIELRNNNAEEWQNASDELKKAVNICERIEK